MVHALEPMRRALHLTKRSEAIIVGSAVASWVVWQVLPRAADPRFQDIEGVFDGAEVLFLRRDVTRLTRTTATYVARAEQIRPTDPELPVRCAPVSLLQSVAAFACVRVAYIDGALVPVVTGYRFIVTAAPLAAVVGGAQVTIIAIQFFADDADTVIAAAVVSLTLARVSRKRHIVAGTRFVDAINRATVSIVLTTRAQVLTAHAVDADLARTAGRSGGPRVMGAIVVLRFGWVAGEVPRVESAPVLGARVAVIAVPARTLIPAPHRAQRT